MYESTKLLLSVNVYRFYHLLIDYTKLIGQLI